MGKIITISAGHGLSRDNRWRRPLMDCRGSKAKVVKSSMGVHQDDFTQGFYREDIGVFNLSIDIQTALINRGHEVHLAREGIEGADIYLAHVLRNDPDVKQSWKKYQWIRHFTNKVNSDIFIELHTNAGGGTGCAAFWRSAPNGLELCNSIANELNSQLGLKIRRIDQHKYAVLKNNCNGRSILLEVLFHDNIKDIQWLLTRDKQRKVAEAIADGVDNYASTF